MSSLPVVLHSGDHTSIENTHFSQAVNGIAVTLNLSASVSINNLQVDNGCILWGHGGRSAVLRNVYSTGIPDKYLICNFDHPLDMLTIDNSAIQHYLQQGEHEAAIRLMQVGQSHIIGCRFRGHQQANGEYWKQVIQDRSGGVHTWSYCRVEGPIQIGYMQDPNIPIEALEVSRWDNCHLDHWPQITPGVKRVEYHNCVIAGALVTKTITH